MEGSAIGDDGNDGLTPATPWLTLQHVVDTADYSSPWVCEVAGTFSLASPLDATTPNANNHTAFSFSSATSAVINLNHSNGIIGDWAYRRLCLRGLTINCVDKLATQGCEVVGCAIDFQKTTPYSNVTDGFHFFDTTITGNSTAYLQITRDTIFHRCLFDGVRYFYLPSGNATCFFDRCRFRNCVPTNTELFAVVDTTSYLRLRLVNCTFTGCGKTGGVLFSHTSAQTSLINTVFADTAGSISDSPHRELSVYRYNSTLGAATSISAIDNSELSESPYADPDGGDWTPSSELAAISDSAGFTPGAVQASGAGGGDPLPHNPFRASTVFAGGVA